MTCPHCKSELPKDHKGKKCPVCGASKTRFHWLLFLCALLLPPILTLLSALTMRITHSDSMDVDDGLSPIVGLSGGLVGGIACGVLLAFRTTAGIPGRVLLSIVFSAIMFVVCLMLCCFGCNIGGFDMEL